MPRQIAKRIVRRTSVVRPATAPSQIRPRISAFQTARTTKQSAT